MPRSIDIVIRSYYRDWPWLMLALRSIEVFVTGHRQVVLVLPRSSLPRVDLPALRGYSGIRLRTCRDYRDDYRGQQITKLYADLHTDADVIVHLDSDQVFVAPCDLRARLFDNGRPRVSFDTSGRRPASDGWRRCPEIFLGESLPWDLATPLPLALPRHLHAELRHYCLGAHGTTIAGYAEATPTARFCELALLRGFALVSRPAEYAWVDVRDGDLLPECWTFWSRGETPATVAHRLPETLATGGVRAAR
jgi:hypothetical protein